MAANHRTTPLIPFAIVISDAQRTRLEAAAVSIGVSTETFATNILMGCISSVEDTQRRERRLMALLLSGTSWETISKEMNLPLEALHRAGQELASRVFIRGPQNVAD